MEWSCLLAQELEMWRSAAYGEHHPASASASNCAPASIGIAFVLIRII
jgi:hypothetical protein